MTKIFVKYFKLLKKKYPKINPISLLLARNLSAFYITLLEEILQQHLSYKQIEQYADEITVFIWNGLHAVMEMKK